MSFRINQPMRPIRNATKPARMDNIVMMIPEINIVPPRQGYLNREGIAMDLLLIGQNLLLPKYVC